MTATDFLLSISASLIASFVFIFLLLFFLRPKIKISPQISYRKDTFDSEGRMCYVIKAVNTSFFSAYDINAELNSMIVYPVNGGYNARYKPLKLKTDRLNFLAPYRWKWMKYNYGDYACLFRTYENLHEILENEQNKIQFQITLRHGLTGLSKVYHVNYTFSSSIKQGHFRFGKDFSIE